MAGANILNPAPGVSLNFTGGSGFASGPNPQAPQETEQANLQARYDGTRTWQRHTFRFGVAVNKIDTLISANLFGLAPQVGSDTGRRRGAVRGQRAFRGRSRKSPELRGEQHHAGKWLQLLQRKVRGWIVLRRLQRYPHAGVSRRQLEGALQFNRYHRRTVRSRYRTHRFRSAAPFHVRPSPLPTEARRPVLAAPAC